MKKFLVLMVVVFMMTLIGCPTPNDPDPVVITEWPDSWLNHVTWGRYMDSDGNTMGLHEGSHGQVNHDIGSGNIYTLKSFSNTTIIVKNVYDYNDYTLCTSWTFSGGVLTFTGGNVTGISNKSWTQY